MARSRVGPLVSVAIVVVAGIVIALNREPVGSSRDAAPASPASAGSKPRPVATAAPTPVVPAADPRAGEAIPEAPIGRDVVRNHIRIVAAWLPAVHVAGRAPPAPGAIHLAARVHAAEGNPHGFARGEWIPYLSIRYRVEPKGGGAPLVSGSLLPIAAGDGPYYGANLNVPGAGPYRLTYRIEPPPASTFPRLDDPVMGIAPWWEPFEAAFDWDNPPR